MSLTLPSTASATAASVFASANKAAAAASTASGSAASTASSTAASTADTTITSSDFLTLLVTEMKNQDPTQPTDPTQYVQQLVGVNSLEQLIAINQGVSALGSTATAKS